MTWRAAIIGCGAIAGGYDENRKDGGCYTHAGAYRRFAKRVAVVAAADPDLRRLKNFGSFWNIPLLYPTFRELKKASPFDIINVCVPDGHHEQVIRHVLDQFPPRVLFAEKPLTLNAPTARHLLEQARCAGTRIVVNCQRRWDKGHRWVRDFIRSGGLGDICGVTIHYVKGLRHIGSTAVNTLRFLVSEVDSVQSIGRSKHVTITRDASQDAALYLRNGAIAYLLAVDRCGYSYSLFEVDILGASGRIRISNNGDDIRLFKVRDYRHYAGFRELDMQRGKTIESGMGESIPKGISEILSYLAGRSVKGENDGEEGYRDLCVTDAILTSSQQKGARVQVRH